jgi:hypothetical protein
MIRCADLLLKKHINPVVGTVPSLAGEAAVGTVCVHAVEAGHSVRKSMQRRTVRALARKIVLIVAVVACGAMVGSHVHRVGGDGHRGGKFYLASTGVQGYLLKYRLRAPVTFLRCIKAVREI